jgi:YVTN family beta-propeller protein
MVINREQNCQEKIVPNIHLREPVRKTLLFLKSRLNENIIFRVSRPVGVAAGAENECYAAVVGDVSGYMTRMNEQDLELASPLCLCFAPPANRAMKNNSRVITVFTLSLFLLAVAFVRGADGPYQFLREITVGSDGGWDYLSVDEAARRLYVSHATKVVVIDIDKNEVVGEIADTPGVHGIALAPKLGRGFVSNGRENKVSFFELKTLQTLSKVETGENPDAILFEPKRAEVYAFNGRSKSATVIDANSAKVVATIPLGGKPEFAQTDTDIDRVFVNIEDKSEVAVIDTAKHEVVTRWPQVNGGQAWSPTASKCWSSERKSLEPSTTN